jgi:hypothetical protein
MVGLFVGTVYGMKSGNPSPVRVGLATAANLGLIAGQFIGFRYILPASIDRILPAEEKLIYDTYMNSLMVDMSSDERDIY